MLQFFSSYPFATLRIHHFAGLQHFVMMIYHPDLTVDRDTGCKEDTNRNMCKGMFCLVNRKGLELCLNNMQFLVPVTLSFQVKQRKLKITWHSQSKESSRLTNNPYQLSHNYLTNCLRQEIMSSCSVTMGRDSWGLVLPPNPEELFQSCYRKVSRYTRKPVWIGHEFVDVARKVAIWRSQIIPK